MRAGDGGGYHGVQPKSALFLATGNDAFAISSSDKNGKTYTECNSMTCLLNSIFSGSNIDGINTANAKRTFAVNLYRNNIDALNIRDMAEMLRLKSVSAAKKLIESVAVDMRDVIRSAI